VSSVCDEHARDALTWVQTNLKSEHNETGFVDLTTIGQEDMEKLEESRKAIIQHARAPSEDITLLRQDLENAGIDIHDLSDEICRRRHTGFAKHLLSKRCFPVTIAYIPNANLF
jgi:hypothetical protein